MAVGTYNVRILALKGKNGYGHAECVLAKARKLGCDFIGLQETGSSALGKKKRKAGKDCSEFGWQSRNRYAVSLFIPIS